MNEILDSLPQNKKSNRVLAKFIIILVVLFIVIYSGWYFGNILFGVRSLDVMLDLHTQREKLKAQVEQMQEENALLQKEYFELIGLDPDSYIKGNK